MTTTKQVMSWSLMLVVVVVLMCKSVVMVDRPLAMNPAESSRLNRVNDTRFTKKSSKWSAVGSIPAVIQRNSTRLIVRAIPKISILHRSSDEDEDYFEAGPVETVTIKCRIKCIATKVEDLPTASFYFQIADETVLPLSSGIPGVDIFTSASQSRKQRPYLDKDDRRSVTTYRSDTHLTLDSSALTFLRPGENSFYCRGYSPSTGLQKSDRFVVHVQ